MDKTATLVSTNLWPNRRQSKDRLEVEDCQTSTKQKIPINEKTHHDIITRSSKRMKGDQRIIRSDGDVEINKRENEDPIQVVECGVHYTLLLLG